MTRSHPPAAGHVSGSGSDCASGPDYAPGRSNRPGRSAPSGGPDRPGRPALSGRVPAGPLAAAVLAAQLILWALAPAQAKAWCDCATAARIAYESAERIVTGIARPLEAAVQRAASYTTLNLHRDLVSLREAVILGQESVSAAVRAADRSAAEREIERSFDLGSQPSTSCGNDDLGAVLLGSRDLVDLAGQAVVDRAAERRTRHDRPVDYLRELSAFPEPKDAASRLGVLPAGRTFTVAELAEAERTLEALSDPLPLPALPEGPAGAPAGRAYEVQKRAYETRLGIYQGVLAKRLADRAPTLDGLESWARSKWESMGGEGDPPGLVEGRLSQEALAWLLSNLRLASANWHESVLPAMTEAGLLREMASMMAVELELSRRRDEHLQNISTMMAIAGLERLASGEGEALRLQYRRALGPAGE
jgi:hypothetical protein